MKTRKRLSVLLIMVMTAMIMTCMSWPSFAAAGLNVTQHSQKEIADHIANSGTSFSEPTVYKTEPIKDTVRGELSDETKTKALAMLNNVRYIAGLDPVSLDDGYGDLAQAAAFVNMSINQLTHYPEKATTKPEAMSDTDWEAGKTGASSCNLASGYTIVRAALGWTYDQDSGNIDRIGHRRWCLNPKMDKTGFGSAGRYTAMYSFGRGGSGSQTNVAWPAANMPVEYFGRNIPWSLSTGSAVTMSNVTVTLTRTNDGKVWTFNGNDTYSPSDSLYFNVNNEGYGQNGCIIFRPDGITEYSDGDQFNVKITGAGSSDIEYTVNFFELTHTHKLVKTEAKAATKTAEGNIEYWTCSKCGKYFKDAYGNTEISLEDTVIPKKTEAEEADENAAASVESQIKNLPSVTVLTLKDEAAVKAASDAYAALTEDQKKLVSASDVSALKAAEDKIKELKKKASDVAAMINALPTKATSADKSAVEAARKAYNALTAEQKKLIDAATLKKLTDAEKAIAEDAKDAEAVTSLINLLSDDITLDDEDSVIAARKAYNALSAAEKALVSKDTLEKLEDAETMISQWKEYNSSVSAAESIQAKISSAKTKKGGKTKISWKKIDNADGYQIRYSTDKKFKKNVKKQNINSYKIVTKTIKLKARKKNYIQIRNFAEITNEATGETSLIYGKWSKIKTVKAK